MSREVDDRIANNQNTEDLRCVKLTKSIIDLALAAYLKDQQDIKAIESTFELFAISQIKFFLFSGHNTTRSFICYIFCVFSRNLTVLKRVSTEHDDVYGTDPKKAGSMITEKPSLLNKIPCSHAIIKETLRLHPAVSRVRTGELTVNVPDDNRRRDPIDGFLVWAKSRNV